MHRILIIDDSEVLNTLVRDFLGNHGYDVHSAGSADEGYRILKNQSIDLILLDVQLPDMGGLDLCRHLRSQPKTHKIPIIMITSTAVQVQDKVQGLQAGADDYLNKPFELSELLERIRAILRRAQVPTNSMAPLGNTQEVKKSEAAPTALTAPTVSAAFQTILAAPWDYPIDAPYPKVVLPFLLILNGLLVAGLAAAPAVTLRPLMACLASLLFWGIVVSVLAVSCSFMGIALTWSEGARIVSLAAVPLLLKEAGAALVAAMTSLSPLLFTASPRLFFPHAPVGLDRIDLFELWTVFLLGFLLTHRPGVTRQKAILVTVLVWGTAVAIALAMSHFGGVS